MLKQFRLFLERLPTWIKNPYLITFAFFAIWMLFIDENSMITQYKKWEELSELGKKKQYYQQQIKIATTAYNELTENAESQEKFAREHFWMKRDNEDVFVIVQNKAEK